MSLSCLWLPGAKQGAFPSVQLRDLRPSLHLCSMHGLTTQVFLPLFLSQGRPGQTAGHRACICHCRSKQNGHSIPQGSARAYGLAGPMYPNGPRQNALRLLLRRPRLSSGACCQASLVLRVWTSRQPFPAGVAFPGRRDPVQGRAGALLFWTPHAWDTVWAWLSTQEILSEPMILMEQRMSLLICSSCADLVFNENHSCSLVCPA